MNKKIHLFGKTIKVSHILLTIIMFGIAFLMIAPFLWVLSASFRTYSEATSLPPKWLPPIIIFVFLLLTRFFSHFHFFIEITSKSMSFPLAINHGYTDV